MSNSTSTRDPLSTSSPASPPTSNTSSPGANSTPTTASTPPTSTPTFTPTPSSTTTTPSSTPPTTTQAPPTTTTPPPTTSTPPPATTIISTSLITPTNGPPTTFVTTVTSTDSSASQPTTSSASPSSSSTGSALSPSGAASSSGLSSQGRIAIAVVVPIVGVALLIFAAIFLWRRHKQRKDAEEQRRKEVEDYTYNPNADPTIPAVAGGAYEMREDASSGYRGWGSTTLAGSTGRKASTTMSGGAAGGAYSDATSPTRNDGTHSSEGEILGAMGPSAANNRGADVHRGPSNASSSYSAAARSDGSGEGGPNVGYGGDPSHYNQFGSNNPYAQEAVYGSPQHPSELGGAPIIRDNPARRNTRIENPAHYPQQSAGISQNF